MTMFKWVILFAFLFTAKASIAQGNIFEGLIDSVGGGPRIDFAEERAKQMDLYADSLNSYRHGALPKFLVDTCFDWNGSLWESLHSPVSVRWIILSKVSNKKALKAILGTKDKRLKLVCSVRKINGYPFLTVPLIEKSFYKLIQKRIRQL